MTRPESRSALFLGFAPAGPRLWGPQSRQVSAAAEGGGAAGEQARPGTRRAPSRAGVAWQRLSGGRHPVWAARASGGARHLAPSSWPRHRAQPTPGGLERGPRL